MKRLLILISLAAAISCTRGFEDMVSNPNSIPEPNPELLLNASLRGSLDFFGGDFNRVVMFNYTQHFTGFQGSFQRYSEDISPLNNYWRDLWTKCVMPANDIIRLYGDDPGYANRTAIARIWKCYLLSQATAIWGPIPYEYGLEGKILSPYDREQDVYYMLFEDLKSAAESIDPAGDNFGTDPLIPAAEANNANLMVWVRFANTLRLRLALRISNPAPNGDPVKAQEVVEELFRDEQSMMSEDSHTVAGKWGGVVSVAGGDVNPLWTRVIYNRVANVGSLPAFGETAQYHMQPYGDPRLPVYAQPVVDKKTADGTTPVHAGEYFGDTGSYGGYGGQSGLAPVENIHSALTREDYSPIGEWFLRPDAEFIFLSYAECCLLKAEAKLKGWGAASSKSAEEYYTEGVRASLDHYGELIAEADKAAYLETPGIKWGTATVTTDSLGTDISAQFMDWLKICNSIVGRNDFQRQVIMQHWLAIPDQGLDAWTLLRRTQVLQFEPCFSPPEGQYKYLPYRLNYPVNELQFNGPEVQKAIDGYLTPRGIFRGNDMYVKLWFALDNKPIAGIPNTTDFL